MNPPAEMLRHANGWRLAANLTTLAVLGTGLLAIAARASTVEVLGLMGVATGLDGLDGWLARRAGGPRLSGAALDLVADMAAFGAAPAALIVTRLEAGWFLLLALGVYLCAALARLVRSCRQYAHRSPIGWPGLPMPACGWLVSAVALNFDSDIWLPVVILGISGLAVSRRLYPSSKWMWANTRGLAAGVAVSSALVALANWPAGLLVASATYALYPLLRPIADAPGKLAT